MSTPLQNFFSAPHHTMRSPHYHCATRSVHIAISIRAAYSRQRQLNRYRRLENDLKKVYGKPSARKHGGRSYNIGANNGSKRGHAQGASAASTHAGKQGRPRRHDDRPEAIGPEGARPHGHGRRTKKSTVDQASAGAHTGAGTGASTATRPHRQRAQRARTHGRRDSERSEQAREQAGTLYIGAMRHMYTTYSVK